MERLLAGTEVAGLVVGVGTVRVVVVVRGPVVVVVVVVPVVGRVVVGVCPLLVGRVVVPEGVTTVRVTVVGPLFVVERAEEAVGVVVVVVVVVGLTVEGDTDSALTGCAFEVTFVREPVTTLLEGVVVLVPLPLPLKLLPPPVVPASCS